ERNHFLVVRPSYTIRHKYPGPLRTYDGEERCEPRLIRLSDMSGSQLDWILNQCEDQDEIKEECESETTETTKGTQKEPVETDQEICNPKREEFLKQFESHIFLNLLPTVKSSLTLDSIWSGNLPTPEQLIRVELRARTLYELSTCQEAHAPTWDSLKSTEKLSFHWQAHAGVKLQETPFDNFQVCYLRNCRKNVTKTNIRQNSSEMRLRWDNMDRSERMPFFIQALLYQVSVGDIDPMDQCMVREFFQKVK
ncbi:hypothetical protein KR059_004637, partial [Drosophila kikkawai]